MRRLVRRSPDGDHFRLLYVHEDAWLGGLALQSRGATAERRGAFLADLAPLAGGQTEDDEYPEGANVRYSWARGRLDTFECERLTVNAARRLGSHPLARCLRVLGVDDDRCAGGTCILTLGPDVPTLDRFRPVEMLACLPAIRNVRAFRFGRVADQEEDEYDVGTQIGVMSRLLARRTRRCGRPGADGVAAGDAV